MLGLTEQGWNPIAIRGVQYFSAEARELLEEAGIALGEDAA